MKTAVLSWSGGKDAAFALHAARAGTANAPGTPADGGAAAAPESPADATDVPGERRQKAEHGGVADDADVEIVELLTTVGAETGRSSIHGVRRELHERQADALGLPITFVEIPEGADNETYEERMAAATRRYEDRGVDLLAFADLALEDVRAYRERRLEPADVDGWWPVWCRDTGAFARRVLDAGFAATVVCVDGDALDASFAGRRFDADLLAALPDGVDPAGENGEFHTFVHDGPPFDRPVPVETGETVTRTVGNGDEETVLHYCDLLPG